jgi:hypothetical protein
MTEHGLKKVTFHLGNLLVVDPGTLRLSCNEKRLFLTCDISIVETHMNKDGQQQRELMARLESRLLDQISHLERLNDHFRRTMFLLEDSSLLILCQPRLSLAVVSTAINLRQSFEDKVTGLRKLMRDKAETHR